MHSETKVSDVSLRLKIKMGGKRLKFPARQKFKPAEKKIEIKEKEITEEEKKKREEVLRSLGIDLSKIKG